MKDKRMKVIEIELCNECPHFGGDLCLECQRLYDELEMEPKEIPDWCPLPDKGD